MWVQRIFGVLYILAGIAKMFPEFENVPEVLETAKEANAGAWYYPVSEYFAAHGEVMNVLVGLALGFSGLALLLNFWVKWVVFCQLAMMAVFILILHRSQPQVLVLDAVFICAAIYIMRYHNKHIELPTRALPSSDFANLSPPSTKAELVIESAYDVVIVGAGASGLAAAIELQGRKILCLEKGQSPGGSAGLEQYGALSFPTGGVCFQKPAPGSPMDKLLAKIGLKNQWQNTDNDTIVFFDTLLLLKSFGEICVALVKHPLALLQPSTWGVTLSLIWNAIVGKRYVVAPKKLGDPIFSDLYSFLDRFSVDSGKFPDVPWHPETGWSREEMEMLDSVSLQAYLFEPEKLMSIPAHLRPQKKLGQLCRRAIDATLRVECLSLNDVSAYVGLHFLLGYLKGSLVTVAGGNGGLTRAMLKTLQQSADFSLKTACEVTGVKTRSNGAKVQFVHGEYAYEVEAKHVVWAACKRSAAEAISGLDRQQLQAMRSIHYQDYYQSAVYFSAPILARYFGGYVIEPDPTKQDFSWCRSCVCLVPNWMDRSQQHEKGVLTLLKPTVEVERAGRDAADQFRALQQQTLQEVSALLMAKGGAPSLVEDVRIWSWRGGLVTAKLGQLKADVFAQASKPYGCVVFAHQDSVGIGNMESSVLAGVKAAEWLTQQACQVEESTTATEEV